VKSELKNVAGLLALAVTAVAAPSAAQDPTDDGANTGSAEAEPTTPSASVGASATAAADVDAAPQRRTGSAVEAPGKPADPPTGTDNEVEAEQKSGWETGASGYFRAPMALGFSKRPGPDDLTGKPEGQISYGPNRTVDSNYYSFGYTRLQEQDWVELFFHAKKKHVQATVGWMGYWFTAAGFRNPDSAWVPGIAYLTLDTDFNVAGRKPNVAFSAGAWWPKFGRFDKYDTYTLGQYRQLGEQVKLSIPFTDDFTATIVDGFGTGRDGSFSLLAPPPYQARVGLNLIHYTHLQFNFKDVLEVGLHHNTQWTRDPNLYLQTSADKSYANVRGARLSTIGAEVKLAVPVAGRLWLSPSLVNIKNGWALGEAGVEVVHGLSPEGLATNYLGWSGSPASSTGTGKLLNFGFLYENSLSNVLSQPKGSVPDVKASLFGLMVKTDMNLPAGSQIQKDKLTHFKWGADVEYNPWKWAGVMLRYDNVNYDTSSGGYLFSAITGRLSVYTNFLSGERIYLQYSRYRYGDNMTLAGKWPWGVPLVAGSDIIQGGPYAGSKPDMDVLRLQADISF
jgi:hypothetical protein